MNIGTVVEGPTDRLVLQAVLDRLLPDDPEGHRYFPLQPTPMFGHTGTGWKGVRSWCYQTWQRSGSNLNVILSGDTGPLLDLLVIHVDADIASETDLQDDDAAPIPDVQQPCPPASATADQLQRVIEHWLHCSPLLPQVVLAIPAQDTESWTFAALFPNDNLCERDDYECIRDGRDHPGYRLTLAQYGKLLRRRGNEIKKSKSSYRQVVRDIAEAWDAVCCICTQAERFTQDLLDRLA